MKVAICFFNIYFLSNKRTRQSSCLRNNRKQPLTRKHKLPGERFSADIQVSPVPKSYYLAHKILIFQSQKISSTLPFIILVQTQIWPIKHAFKEAVRSKHVQGPALCKRSFYLDITPCLGRNAVSWEQGMRKIQNTIQDLQKNFELFSPLCSDRGGRP